MKKIIISFILGLIVAGGIGVIAYNYNAKNIEYTPSDNSWNVNTVGDAIDSLKANNFTVISTGSRKSSGSTINVDEGTYLIVLSFNPITVTNADVVSRVSDFARVTSDIGTEIVVYKVTSTSSKVTVEGGKEFGYINFK